MRQKIFQRLAKAEFYNLNLEDAAAALSKHEAGATRLQLEPSLSITTRIRETTDEKTWRDRVLDRLPKYKPQL